MSVWVQNRVFPLEAIDRQTGSRPDQALDLTGQRFGRWTVLDAGRSGGRGPREWVCRCDCGTTRPVLQASLKRGQSLSCGCLRAYTAWPASVAACVTHHMSDTAIYARWKAMQNRCYNPRATAYQHYGGRGITVCDRWHSFANFYADMGDPPPGHSLDRIDNNGPYAPENCRWASTTTQRRNQRPPKRTRPPRAQWTAAIESEVLAALARDAARRAGAQTALCCAPNA